MKNHSSSIESGINTKNKYNQGFCLEYIDKVLHKSDKIDNQGERIESDDCMSDDDGYDFDDIEIDYHHHCKLCFCVKMIIGLL